MDWLYICGFYGVKFRCKISLKRGFLSQVKLSRSFFLSQLLFRFLFSYRKQARNHVQPLRSFVVAWQDLRHGCNSVALLLLTLPLLVYPQQARKGETKIEERRKRNTKGFRTRTRSMANVSIEARIWLGFVRSKSSMCMRRKIQNRSPDGLFVPAPYLLFSSFSSSWGLFFLKLLGSLASRTKEKLSKFN